MIAIAVLGGLGTALYPSASQWISSYSQSTVVRSYADDIETVEPDATEQLAAARRYNEALNSGVDLVVGERIPTSTGTTHPDARTEQLHYADMLRANAAGMMARLRLPAARVDLPVYHGTDDKTLLKGAGHLRGSHLPVGGASTHAVITAHRGLASATMFSKLDAVQPGDRFTLETFGEAFVYEVRTTQVIEPHETDSLRAEEGRDLVTLVTCTPLGVNTHRILVTGERVSPTPEADLAKLGAPSDIPAFPWWLVGLGAGLAVVAGFVWRAGYSDAQFATTSR